MTKEEIRKKFILEHPHFLDSKREETVRVYQRRYKKNIENKMKIRARRAVWYWLTQAKTNRIKKLPCEVCGDTKTDAHHSDYSKPLDIMWLCREHHFDWHKVNKCVIV